VHLRDARPLVALEGVDDGLWVMLRLELRSGESRMGLQ
jgi:hypothetical protein